MERLVTRSGGHRRGDVVEEETSSSSLSPGSNASLLEVTTTGKSSSRKAMTARKRKHHCWAAANNDSGDGGGNNNDSLLTITMGEDDSAETVADEVSEERTSAGTKSQYRNKMADMMSYFRNYHSSYYVTGDTGGGSLRLPLHKDHVMEFFGELCRPAHVRKQVVDPADIPDGQSDPYSISRVRSYRSALVDYYKSAKLKLAPDLDVELTTLLDGYSNLIANLKKRGLMKIGEGKHKLNIGGYRMLAKKFFLMTPTNTKVVAGNWKTMSFMWSYFILMWNLMSRTESIDALMLQHIWWDGDALIVEEQSQKGDRKGKEKFGKNVYANPFEPMICPVLALAVYVFSYPQRSGFGKQQLFAGTNSKDRFGKNLHSILNKCSEDDLLTLGCVKEDIGTHSCRKGGSSYCLGQVEGPSPVTVFLRMGHSLGQLKDRYIHAEKGKDALCGRMICGLDYLNENFGVLAPHFRNAVAGILSEDFWTDVLPDYNAYPLCFRTTFPFLLASLLHCSVS